MCSSDLNARNDLGQVTGQLTVGESLTHTHTYTQISHTLASLPGQRHRNTHTHTETHTYPTHTLTRLLLHLADGVPLNGDCRTGTEVGHYSGGVPECSAVFRIACRPGLHNTFCSIHWGSTEMFCGVPDCSGVPQPVRDSCRTSPKSAVCHTLTHTSSSADRPGIICVGAECVCVCWCSVCRAGT